MRGYILPAFAVPLQQRRPAFVQEAAPRENVAHRCLLVEHPGVHGVEELLAGHEVHCKASSAKIRLRSADGLDEGMDTFHQGKSTTG
jgi:hypothetical protein